MSTNLHGAKRTLRPKLVELSEVLLGLSARCSRNSKLRPSAKWAFLRCSSTQLFEREIQNRVSTPILVIEVPPFELVDLKTLRFHGMAQQVAMPALNCCSAGIKRIRPLGHFIIDARHLDRFARFQIIESQIHRAAAIVARALLRIGN